MNHVITAIREDGYLLQGLIGLPTGLWLLLMAGNRGLWPELHQNWDPLLTGVWVLLWVTGYYATRPYYQAGHNIPRSAFGGSLVLLAILVLGFLTALSIEVFYRDYPASLSGLWLGLYLLVLGYRFVTHV